MQTYSIQTIKKIKQALIDDAAGNKQATMTDLDMAVKMLDLLIFQQESIMEYANPLYDRQKVHERLLKSIGII